MKIRMSELKKIVIEEMKKLKMIPMTEADKLKLPEDADTVDVEPGDEGRHNEKQVDKLKALKIKEATLVKSLRETRARIQRCTGK